MNSQFENNVSYRRSMLGRRAFSNDQYDYSSNDYDLQDYNRGFDRNYNYQNYSQVNLNPNDFNNIPTSRRYSLQQQRINNYNQINVCPYEMSGTNIICDNTMNNSIIPNERNFSYVMPKNNSRPFVNCDSRNNNDHLENQFLNKNLKKTPRLMPKLPFKSLSTESKNFVINNTKNNLINSNYFNGVSKPVVQSDHGLFNQNLEATFNNDRRFNEYAEFTSNYYSPNKINVNNNYKTQNNYSSYMDQATSSKHLADYEINNNNYSSYNNFTYNANTNGFNQSLVDYNKQAIMNQLPLGITSNTNNNRFNIISSAKNFISGSVGNLLGSTRASSSLNATNLQNLQVPSVNYMNSTDFQNNPSHSINNSNNNLALQSLSNFLPINNTSTYNKNLNTFNSSRKINSFGYPTDKRMLLRQESDQTGNRRNRLHSIENSYRILNRSIDSYNVSRSPFIQPSLNTLQLDNRNRLNYQISFSTPDLENREENNSIDSSIDCDKNNNFEQTFVKNFDNQNLNNQICENRNCDNQNYSQSLYNDAELIDREEDSGDIIEERFGLIINNLDQYNDNYDQNNINQNSHITISALQNKFLIMPMTWHYSNDNQYIIRNISLNNDLIISLQKQRSRNNLSDEFLDDNESYANIFGIKVIDGTSYGSHGAIVEKVQNGSIAHLVARIKTGDKILRWNRISLLDKNFEQIYDIMNESKLKPHLDIVVARKNFKSSTLDPNPFSRSSINYWELAENTSSTKQINKKILMHQSNFNDETRKRRLKICRSLTISGRLQLRIRYDLFVNQLVVSIISAVELPPCSNGQPRNTFCRLVLLPNKFKKRTKLVIGSNEPVYNQTFVYPSIKRSDLKTKCLEIKLFHLEKNFSELLGCVLVELSSISPNDDNEWFLLESYEEFIEQWKQFQRYKCFSEDRLSPNSTISCLSESEISEIDLIDYCKKLNLSSNEDNYLLSSNFDASISSPTHFHTSRNNNQTQLPSSNINYENCIPTTSRNSNFNNHHSPNRYSKNNSSIQKSNYNDFYLDQNSNLNLKPNSIHVTNKNLNQSFINNEFNMLHNHQTHPQFTKCQSQPSRSVSPCSARSYSPLIFEPVNSTTNNLKVERLSNRNYSYNDAALNILPRNNGINSPLKRQLPQLPSQKRNLNVNKQYFIHPGSFDSSISYLKSSKNGYRSDQFIDNINGSQGFNSVMSNYDSNNIKQYSQSSILLAHNRSIEGMRSPQPNYSEGDLTNNLYNSSMHHYQATSPYLNQSASNGPIFYHHYHKGGDYTKLTKQDIEEEMDRNKHRFFNAKKHYQYYEEKILNKPNLHLKEQKRQENLDENNSQDQEYYDDYSNKQNYKENSSNDFGETFEKSYDLQERQIYNSNELLTNLSSSNEKQTRLKKSSTSKLDDELNGLASLDQLDEQMNDLDIIKSNETLEAKRNEVKEDYTKKIRTSRGIRNKSYSNVINESGEEESESSSLTKSINSSISDCKKTSRTVGDFTKRGSNFGPVHPKQRSNLARSIERNSIEEQDEKNENSPEVMKHLSDEVTDSNEKLARNKLKGKKVALKTNGLDKNSETSTSNMNLTKIKSSSTSQLSVSGTKKRLGFRTKQAPSYSVHRSEEVAPDGIKHLVRQTSSDGEGSISGGESINAEMSEFLKPGLGPGQLTSRESLASPYLGDIQFSICDKEGSLEVEIIRGKQYQFRPHSKIIPSTYVKVNLFRETKCIAKARTTPSRGTTDPLYQQKFVFNEDYRGCNLQVWVCCDYGKMGKKKFLGVVQIMLDNLDSSKFIIGWYKLFHPSTLITVASDPNSSKNSMFVQSSGSFN